MTSVVLSLAFHTWADGVSRQMSWSSDRVAQQLCADPAVETLLVADPLRSQLARLRRRAVAADEGFPSGPRRRFVRPRRWRRTDSHDRSSAVRTYQRLDRWLADRNEALGWPEAVLVSCHPVLAAVADRSRWADVVYYGWDDWLTYPPMAAARDLMAWSYDEMASRDVNVVGVTQAIVDRVGASRSAVVPNGISLADYASPAQTPGWFDALDRPVAFYAGALEDRVDVEALEDLARDLPDWSVVLVGHMKDPARFERLLRRPNVIFHELQPRPTVLAMMAAADVCLVPHRRTPMSVAMSPLKLYEYLAAGTPVVASDLEPMRGLSDRCLLVEPGAELAPAVRRAAQLPRATAEDIARFRADNDWSSRYRDWATAALGAPRSQGRGGGRTSASTAWGVAQGG
jgi:teichuronic acid biosynthesis glycosyltransferase TuaH